MRNDIVNRRWRAVRRASRRGERPYCCGGRDHLCSSFWRGASAERNIRWPAPLGHFPWNGSFARDATEPAFALPDEPDSHNARMPVRDFLPMSQSEFSARVKGSAKRRGLARNTEVVLGNVGTHDDVPLLAAALQDAGRLVRDHAAWAFMRLRLEGGSARYRDRPRSSARCSTRCITSLRNAAASYGRTECQPGRMVGQQAPAAAVTSVDPGIADRVLAPLRFIGIRLNVQTPREQGYVPMNFDIERVGRAQSVT